MEVKITVRNNQTLWDIALQEGGSIEAAVALMKLNNVSPSDLLAPGDSIIVSPLENTNRDVLTYYKGYNIHPATGGEMKTDEGIPQILDEGIGFWEVGEDFIVN